MSASARAVAQLGEEATLLDYAADWIAAGRSVQALAESLAAELETSVSRPLVSSILHNAAPDASNRLDAARREAAEALVEEATQIADACEPTAGAAAAARLQVGTRQWLAERFAPERFGQKGNAVQVNLSVGALMLDTLRQPIVAEISVPDQPALIPSAAESVEYQIAE